MTSLFEKHTNDEQRNKRYTITENGIQYTKTKTITKSTRNNKTAKIL